MKELENNTGGLLEENLMDRLFIFSVDTLKFLPKLPKSPEMQVVRLQLAKSSSSAGANYEEAQSGSSKADFNNKVRISYREMRESNYWLRILDKVLDLSDDNDKLIQLIDESEQLKRILGTIVTKTNRK